MPGTFSIKSLDSILKDAARARRALALIGGLGAATAGYLILVAVP